jgi:geranylgeranyl diphosphate synthase type II
LRLPEEPRELYDPVRYVLEADGKRIRPVLLLLSAESHGGPEVAEAALPAALAVEVFHDFTLVHDDIMDHASERRGRPTVHRRWDEATAILAGDLLFGLAYDLLSRAPANGLPDILALFHTAVVRLCEGQAMDKAMETASAVTVAQYVDMIERKTAALLEAALQVGATIGGAPPADVEALGRAGRALGRAFQVQDDLLDVTADGEGWGKIVGGDLVVGKRTFLLLTALERAAGEERRWFERALDGITPDEVPEARERMRGLGVLDAAREAVERDVESGLEVLASLPAGPAADALRTLCGSLAGRTR